MFSFYLNFCDFPVNVPGINPHDFTIKDNQKQAAHSVKDLGIHISQDLKWKTHVGKVASFSTMPPGFKIVQLTECMDTS